MIDSSILKLFLIGSNNEGLRSAVEIGLSSTIDLINLPAPTGFGLREWIKIPKKYPLGIIPYSYGGIAFKLIKAPKDSAVKNVAMGETEVTQELFEAVMGFNPSYFKNKPDSPQRPVEEVSWFDCILFCNRLSHKLRLAPYYKLTDIKRATKMWINPRSIESASVEELKGDGFRLPNVNEWELFANPGTNKKWSGTDEQAKLGGYAWFDDNSFGKTHPVAQKKPNEWGLYDMSGNVYEWCWNKYKDTAADASAFRDHCGGSWGQNGQHLRSVIRNSESPSNCCNELGFRICRTIN